MTAPPTPSTDTSAPATPAPATPAPRWLTLVGLGEDGPDGLIPAARAALAQAALVVGGARHLALVAPLLDGGGARTLPWPSPLEGAFPAIAARRGDPVVVLATGDPFFHGVGSLIARHVDPAEIATFPAPSAYGLAAARLGWAGQDAVRVSLHGRALELVLPHLHPGARILALSWDAETPARLAALLTRHGFGASRLTVLAAMGGPREAVATARADAFDLPPGDPLNTVAIQVAAAPGARVIPFTPGLPDAFFEHDGQITKRAVRAVTLSALMPTRGALLLDVGAGSGSVGIEWMLADPSCRAIAVEPRADRRARIARNAEALGVPGLAVVAGEAPAALAGLPEADAVFVGGGATAPGALEAAMAALRPGGRLVVNAVTLETQALLVDRHGRHGGDLIQLSIADAAPVGGFRALRPAMAVLQWTWTKPADASGRTRPETETQTTAEPSSHRQPQSPERSQSHPETRPQPAPQPPSQAQSHPEPQPQAAPQPLSQPKPQPQSQPRPSSLPQSQPQPVQQQPSQAQSHPETQPQAAPQPLPEPKPQPLSQPRPSSLPQPQPPPALQPPAATDPAP